MLPDLTGKTLRDGRRALIGWSAGVALFTLVYGGSFANFQDDTETARDAEDRIPSGVASLVGGIGDLSTGAGYLQTVVFQTFLPLLVIACAVVWSVRAVAAPEESGALDLLLSVPLSRRQYILARALAMVVSVVAAAVVVWVIVLLLNNGLDMGVSFAEITATTLGLLLVGLVFGSFALAVSAFVGRRSIVLAVTGAVALGTFVVRSLSVDNESIEPLRWISPFQYYLGNEPLYNGFHLGYVAVLVTLVAALLATAVAAFDRRDIGV